MNTFVFYIICLFQPAPTVFEDAAAARTAIFDEIWTELAKHDAFFDPQSPENRQLRKEVRQRLAAMDDPMDRRREIVRVLSGMRDGHLHLTSRWFLPDKPPPPLPLSNGDEMYRPGVGLWSFHRDYYVAAPKPAPQGGTNGRGTNGKGPSPTELCRITRIDGALAEFGGWTLLNGAKDTPVTIEIERPDGKPDSLRLTRSVPVNPRRHFSPTTQRAITTTAPDKPPSTKVETVEVVVEHRRLKDNVGYIRIDHLTTQQVIKDFDAALDDLMDTDGLILDLRDTGGGYPWIMAPIFGRFIDKAQRLCSFDGRSPLIGTMLRVYGKVGLAPRGKTYAKPLVVLINDNTASMSEGLAFCLRDTDRATLIGRPTRGLGAAIRNTTLSDGTVLWHSWIRVKRLDGTSYQGVGVEPNERVELSPNEVRELGISKALRTERQRQMERAVTRIKTLISAAANP